MRYRYQNVTPTPAHPHPWRGRARDWQPVLSGAPVLVTRGRAWQQGRRVRVWIASQAGREAYGRTRDMAVDRLIGGAT